MSSNSNATETPATPTRPAVKRPAAVLLVSAYCAFLATFNETFLNVALSPIMADFGISSGTVQWVSTAYMLMAAIMVPVAGLLYRRIPTKRLAVLAAVLLLAGSLIGLFSPSFPVLLIGRVVQALGTGMMVPISMNVTVAVAPRNKIGSYMGVVSAMTTLGPAFGPIIAGTVLSLATWHALFGVFALLVAIAVALCAAILPNVAELTHPSVDVASICLVSLALIGVLYGISTIFSGSVAIAAACIVAGLAFGAAFVVRQRRVPEPLVDMRPFGNVGFDLGVALIVIALMIVFAMNILLPLLMQGALGFTAMQAALTLLPACILSCVMAPVAGRVYDRVGMRAIVPCGMALVAVFTLLLSRMVSVNIGPGLIVALYAPVVVGTAVVMGPAQPFALSRLPRELYPHGVTIVSTSFQVAGCIGSSLFVGVMSGVEAAGASAGIDAALATVNGFSVATLVGSCIALVGFALALWAGAIEVRSMRSSGAERVRPSSSIEREPVSDTAAQGAQVAGLSLVNAAMETDVWSVADDASAYDALACMVEHHTSGLPVLRSDRTLAGFISDGDIIRAMVGGERSTVDFSYVYALWATRDKFEERVEGLRDIPVMELATRRVVSVERGAGIEGVCEKLADTRIKKLPVTEDGRVVGTLSRSDLMRQMVGQAGVAE
jgi:DHA2 family lincomycin resistance protein-like MFS transporter